MTAPRASRLSIAMLALVALTVAPGRAAAQTSAPSAPAADAPRRLLVIPFDDLTREPRLYWLSEGSAVVLTNDLAALGAPAIPRDDRLRAFDRLEVPTVAALSDATVIRLGEIVGASAVVLGGFEVQDDQITVRAREIEIEAGRLSPDIVESGPLTDLFAVYERVARKLAPEPPAPGAPTVGAQQEHPPLPAFEQYVKGLLAEAPSSRLSFLNQALRLDPTLHPARLALWDVYTEQSDYQKALATVRQIPDDDPLAREARFRESLTLVNLEAYEQAYARLTELERAKASATLLNDLGVVQLRRGQGAPGGRAVTFFADAARLDPSDADLFFNLGYAYWFDHDAANAVAELREAVRRNPADAQAHYVLALVLQSTGKGGEATRERELARQLSSEYANWEAHPAANGGVPKGLARVKTDLDGFTTRRLDDVIETAGQRNAREQAAFHLDAARRLVKAERDGDAIGELRRGIFLSPYDSEAHLLLGRLYLREGEVPQAIEELKISIWSRDTPAAHLDLANAYVAAKNASAARAEAQIVLKRDPSNTQARAILDTQP